MNNGRRIAEFLLDVGAVKLSVDPPFTWTTGIKSPIYCDNRMLYSHPEARSFIVDRLVERVRNLHVPPDVIAGTATAAIGWAALVADRLRLPFVYVRSKPKAHGMGKLIEGDLRPERHVAVVEDLISTATSAIATAEALRTEGKAIVTDIVSIVSYDFVTAREKAESASVHLHPLAGIGVILEEAVEQGRLSAEEADTARTFVADPEQWAVMKE